MKKLQLSVVIIAKNAENFLVDCIESVSFADEIIVVDNKSIDHTVEVAKRARAKVIHAATDDFAQLRNKGLEQAKGEWVLYIDTDERVSTELQTNINYLLSLSRRRADNIQYPNQYTAYKIKRKNFYLGNHEWPHVEKLERLFKKDKLKKWYGKLHETPDVVGNIGELNGFLLHFSHRDLSSMLTKTISWSSIEAQLRFDSNHPRIVWWRLVRVMITGFWNSYSRQRGWKAGVAGFIESIYQAYSMFITYVKLWEKQKSSL